MNKVLYNHCYNKKHVIDVNLVLLETLEPSRLRSSTVVGKTIGESPSSNSLFLGYASVLSWELKAAKKL